MISKISESEINFTAFVNSCDAMLWVADTEGNNLFANEALLSYTGATAEEFSGVNWQKYIHPEDRQIIREKFSQARLADSKFVLTFRIQGKDGIFKWVKCSFNPASTTTGEYYHSTFEDITREIHLNKRYSRSITFIQNFLGKHPGAICIVNNKGKILYVNPKMEELTGYESSDISGQDVSTLFPFQHSIHTQLTVDTKCEKMTYTIRRKNLELKNISLTVQPVAEEGQEIFFACELSDIPMEGGSEPESYSTDIENYSGALFWVSDNNGKILFLNNNWFDYTGIETGFLSRKGWESVLHEDDRERISSRWRSSVSTGIPFEEEARVFCGKDKDYKWQIIRAFPVRSAKGEIMRWVGISTDIDDLKKLELEKDDFLSMASHELKTPLSSIKAYIQLLNRKCDEDSENSYYIKKSEQYVEKLINLINELLDTTRLKFGRLQYFMSVFYFDSFVRDCVENFQKTLPSHKIFIRGGCTSKVFADRLRIEQVITNLLSNAGKYSPGKNQIDVELEEDENEVRVKIKDYGIGIPEAAQEKLFRRFYRVESNKNKYPGLGIGLYISAEIIRNHEGKLTVSSKEGNGSEFCFTIPRAS